MINDEDDRETFVKVETRVSQVTRRQTPKIILGNLSASIMIDIIIIIFDILSSIQKYAIIIKQFLNKLHSHEISLIGSPNSYFDNCTHLTHRSIVCLSMFLHAISSTKSIIGGILIWKSSDKINPLIFHVFGFWKRCCEWNSINFIPWHVGLMWTLRALWMKLKIEKGS